METGRVCDVCVCVCYTEWLSTRNRRVSSLKALEKGRDLKAKAENMAVRQHITWQGARKPRSSEPSHGQEWEPTWGIRVLWVQELIPQDVGRKWPLKAAWGVRTTLRDGASGSVQKRHADWLARSPGQRAPTPQSCPLGMWLLRLTRSLEIFLFPPPQECAQSPKHSCPPLLQKGFKRG